MADQLHNEYNLHLLAVGTGQERDIIERIRTLASCPFINLAGQTTLNQLVSLLRGACLVVANDTGPGHIAAGLGVPMVMLFSWSNPARIYPYGRPECIAAIEPFNRGTAIKSRDPKHSVLNVPLQVVYEKACEQLDASE